MKRALIIILVVIVGLGLFAYSTFKNTNNQLVTLEERVNAQWGQVQSVYQRRADLIPNLVETVKAAGEYEEGVLTQVADARAQVGKLTVSKEVLENPQLMERFNESQNQLSQALSRLLSVNENYPDLKANSNYQALLAQLEGTENRIAVERRRFNEEARGFNTQVRQFPTSIFAGMLGFHPVAYFEADAGSQNAPQVNFDS